MTGAKVNRDRLIVSAELPPRGERFEGVRPPMTRGPCFAIRKFAGGIFALEDYVSADVVTVHCLAAPVSTPQADLVFQDHFSFHTEADV